MKVIKFRKALADQILQGKKTTTWRLFDDKDLQQGDTASLVIWETGKEFAKAKLIIVKEKCFNELTEADWEGHEKFSSEQEMYATYNTYYKKEINEKTKLKIIKLELT